uniref:Uncharacterized protein n=1 Tax=Pelodiscus sinensis TaxID=13735 RepID=K7FEZ1_PELSI
MNSVSPASVQYVSQDERHHSDGRKLFNPRAGSQDGGCNGLFPGGAPSGQPSEPDEVDKIKSKLLSAWNNVKYGWTVKTKSSFSKLSPVYLFGHVYRFEVEGESPGMQRWPGGGLGELPGVGGGEKPWGWGTMSRSAFLAGDGCVCRFKPVDWTWHDALFTPSLVEPEPLKPASPSWPGSASLQQLPVELEKERRHRTIVSWFADHPPAPGWRVPATNPALCPVARAVYKGDVARLASGSDGRTERKAVVILVPMRLGGEALNPVYVDCVK